jgi:predicted transcriptional regulator
VTLAEIKELLKAEVLSNKNNMDREIRSANASDLMSDVLAFADAGSLLLTGLTNAQVIRTCEIAGICAVVFVRGKKPAIETVKMSEEFSIPVLATKLTMFEACGVLYAHGLAPQSVKT